MPGMRDFGDIVDDLVAYVRPRVDRQWNAILDGGLQGGEYVLVLDDALQAAALAGIALPAKLRSEVEAEVADPELDQDDARRLRRWLDAVPSGQVA